MVYWRRIKDAPSTKTKFRTETVSGFRCVLHLSSAKPSFRSLVAGGGGIASSPRPKIDDNYFLRFCVCDDLRMRR